MATQIIIRNLDPEVVARLNANAKAAGQSLQAYMAGLATSAAATLSVPELVDRARRRMVDRSQRRPTRRDVLTALAEPR